MQLRVAGYPRKFLSKSSNTLTKSICFPACRVVVSQCSTSMVIKVGKISNLFDCITTKHHRWKVCLGVSYVTTIWQIGDASEHNDRGMLEWYREKEDMVTWKLDHNLPCSIQPKDISHLSTRSSRSQTVHGQPK